MTTNLQGSNRYPAPCARCGETVATGEGLVSGGRRGEDAWRVVHDTCIPSFLPQPRTAPLTWHLLI